MDNIDIIYMDDDFNFDSNISKKIDTIDIDNSKVESNNSDEDIFKETYNIIDRYNNMKNQLKTNNNELNLLQIKYENLQTKYNSLEKKYNKNVNLNENNSNEIKTIRKNLIESNKNVLMLRTLLELIINKYGMDNVCEITKLNEEQINRYLNKKN